MGAALADFNSLFLCSTSGVMIHGLFLLLVHGNVTFKEWKKRDEGCGMLVIAQEEAVSTNQG
jgi:hypothetical protein